ncbi:hypothetical protein PV458_42935 [Streptomyces sp. MN03-5084-2B]|nr:hypothetical protein [Streptomyces sp. MN03-5084-2B]
MPTLAVLVATARTQGQRGNDFLARSPDELVDITSSCDRGNPDGGCGCCRAFTGLDSRKATTTAEVVERPISFARDMARIAADFPVGTVVERRGDQILERVEVAAATPAR